MKILVVNPPGPYCRAGSRWPHSRKETQLGYFPFPFFLAYTTSVLLKNGYQADIKDCITLNWNIKKLKSYVKKFNPDIIVMETSAPSYHHDSITMKSLGVPTVAVGAHASATFKQHLKDGFDYVAVGEYDFSILELVKFLDGKREKLPYSVASKKRPSARYAKLIENLDALPWPPWHLMPMNKYSDPFCLGRNVAVLSSRGCPFRCSFCNVAVFYGKPSYRVRNPKKVCDEIEFLISKYKPDEIYFDDDSITVSKSHILELCKEIKKRNFGIPWSCMGDARVDPKILEAMADAGCRAMKFGVETGDKEVLKNIPKYLDLSDVKKTVDKCIELGIKTHATYVFGLPGENYEKAKKTIDFALKLNTDTLQFAIVTPYPGTRLYKMAERNNWLITKNWEKFDASSSGVLSYPDYSAKEIEEVNKMAWTAWNRFMITRKPQTIFHHLYGVYRREGILKTIKTVGWGCKRVITGAK